ncbi:MAG: alkaline phosphatase family protein [Firmicutes bacterium]|nr:alkaline phosphatase family protein [Bacillota bacterium]
MNPKVILISIDGMRPDGVLQCGNPYVQELMQIGSYTLDAQTVYPSVTMPCHTSMFHGVSPERHGMLSSKHLLPIDAVPGIMEQVRAANKAAAMFYNWEPLRKISQPGSLNHAFFIDAYVEEYTDNVVTQRALECVQQYHPDFVFLYMLETDDKGGHNCGWMTPTYLHYLHNAINNVKKVQETIGDEYIIIVTADHGGHDCTHGTTMPEDMTIPMFFLGEPFQPGKELHGVSILDLAPTIAKILHLDTPSEWEGNPLV